MPSGCICVYLRCSERVRKKTDREAEVERGIFLRNGDEQAEECGAMRVWAGRRRGARVPGCLMRIGGGDSDGCPAGTWCELCGLC